MTTPNPTSYDVAIDSNCTSKSLSPGNIAYPLRSIPVTVSLMMMGHLTSSAPKRQDRYVLSPRPPHSRRYGCASRDLVLVFTQVLGESKTQQQQLLPRLSGDCCILPSPEMWWTSKPGDNTYVCHLLASFLHWIGYELFKATPPQRGYCWPTRRRHRATTSSPH